MCHIVAVDKQLMFPLFVPSLQEAARYLETYKSYEQKSAESIQEKVRTRLS